MVGGGRYCEVGLFLLFACCWESMPLSCKAKVATILFTICLAASAGEGPASQMFLNELLNLVFT